MVAVNGMSMNMNINVEQPVTTEPCPTLLIVDDEPAMASLMAISAEVAGFSAQVTHSGREFQEKFLGSNPSLIIMDVAIPDKAAAELLPWLRDAGNVAPIILISGYDYMLSWAFNIGEKAGGKVIHTLCKPINLRMLDDILSVRMHELNWLKVRIAEVIDV